MSIDLIKCMVGDKLKRRDGRIMIIDSKNGQNNDYPVRCHHNGNVNLCHWYSIDGKSCLNNDTYDIIRVVGSREPKPKRKVAKCEILDKGWGAWLFSVDNMRVESFVYTSRKTCIRGARRFCKRIGFECVIINP